MALSGEGTECRLASSRGDRVLAALTGLELLFAFVQLLLFLVLAWRFVVAVVLFVGLAWWVLAGLDDWTDRLSA